MVNYETGKGVEGGHIVVWLQGSLRDHMGQIPKALPPVLNELKLKQAQDIIAFLDRMEPYLKFDSTWGTECGGPIRELRTVIIGCRPGRAVG